ncbi:disease resistance protein Pik-2-like [Oryza glaberrima]|uniref:AAA+ ATPase domain-containing protein n=1 Tax=Oryza barthii TaxID=65489 RepID=A0A0D3FSS0_9ORYZ|nr:disease resistance protein Pik-2-like [Oryza glaberrima]
MELAVGASASTMKSLLSKLGGLLGQEYTLIRGVRGDIQYINDELASMQAFLINLGSGDKEHDAQIKDWMKQIRDIAYDIEDCVDDFAHRLPKDPGGEVRCSFIRTVIQDVLTWYPRRDIAAKIVELKNRAEQIGARRTRYGVPDPQPGTNNGVDADEAAFLAAENQVAARQIVGVKEPVGMADAKKKLEPWIKDSTKKGRSVLSIVGFGGVGKTTVAMDLYRKFGGQFDHRASVNVSQKFELESILKEILNQVKPQVAAQKGDRARRRTKTDSGENNKIREELRQHLKGKRYFLVIDDVWSASAWEEIRNCLPSDEARSIIIVTTRFQAVASICIRDKNDLLHKVEHLHDKESKILLEESVSESKHSTKDKGLINPTENILKLCNGLPLVIVTLAGLVACRRDKFDKQWEDISKFLPQQLVNCHTPEGVKKILNYCYNELPGDLRTCSLYLSVFPKAHKISRKRLTRRWIAEGFVSEKHGQSIEELAESYFNQLIRRKILRPVEHNNNGKVKTCQVHDMVLEYIIAKSSEENFITVVGGHWLMPTPRNKVRRLSLHSTDLKHVKETTSRINLSHLRSLTVFGNLSQLASLSFKYGILQVLDLQDCKGFKKHHVKAIFKMLFLKYLNLRRTDVKYIPTKIGKLKYLETLDIRETDVRDLPDAIVQLEKLTEILGGNKHTQEALKLPKEIEKKPMKSLQTLSGIEIIPELTAVPDLHEYTGLKKLAIYKLNIKEKDANFRTFLSSIEYLGGCSLGTLVIHDEASDFLNSLDSMTSPPKYLSELELHGMLIKVPHWISYLGDLRMLTLSMSVLRTDTLQLLGQLGSLFSLTFSFNTRDQIPYLEEILYKNKSDSNGEIVIPNSGFKNLKLLRLYTPVLPLLIFSEEAMPELERLHMRFKVLEGIFGMETLVKLHEVHLEVNEKAGKFTKSVIADLAKAARKYSNKPRVIVDEYYDKLK